MTAAPSDAPASTQAPPERTGSPEWAPVHVVTRAMRSQPRPICIEYMVDPAAFACAVLPEAAALLAGGAPDRVLAARASAVEKLRDDLALLVRWPALQASLETDAQALRAAMRSGRTPSDLDRQILVSIRSTGTTNAARAEAQRNASILMDVLALQALLASFPEG